MTYLLDTNICIYVINTKPAHVLDRFRQEQIGDIAISSITAVNAFVAVDYDRALTEADAADAKIFRGEPVGLLEGIPFGVKDVHDSHGFKTSMGSHLTDGLMPAQEDSDIVSKLKKQGAITIGKTNTPEFAWEAISRNVP